MNEILFLTIDCPMCEVLEDKLKENEINFKTVNDLEFFKEKNISHFPCLSVNGEILNTKESFKFVESYKGGNTNEKL